MLVTYDNDMPVEHGPLLVAYGTSLAIVDVDGHHRSGLTLEEYWREVIHRHAHRFNVQPPATIWKYRCSDRRTRVTPTV